MLRTPRQRRKNGAALSSDIDKGRTKRTGDDFIERKEGRANSALCGCCFSMRGHGPQWIVSKVAEALGVTSRSLEHLKKRFVEEGFTAAIERKKCVTPPREIRFGREFEAKLLALACSPAPEGRKRWTARLLAEKMVALETVPNGFPMTVCNTLKNWKSFWSWTISTRMIRLRFM